MHMISREMEDGKKNQVGRSEMKTTISKMKIHRKDLNQTLQKRHQ